MLSKKGKPSEIRTSQYIYFMKNTIILACLISLFSACAELNQPIFQRPNENQETALYYLYNKSLLSDTFSRILYQMPLDCRGIDVEKDLLYFICPDSIARNRAIQAVAIDSHKVEFSPCKTGDCVFGGLQGNIDGYFAFRMPTLNLKADSHFVFHCNLKNYPFSFKLAELHTELDSTIFYNYKKNVDMSTYYTGRNLVTNIGAYISKPGKDPLIHKLTAQLIKGISSQEEKAQKLLDFVSTQIEYSYEDYWYRSEITKRAHEVLFSGEADCSGKTTLLASMLEDAGIPYCLLYFPNHVNVGIAGNFSKQNHYHIELLHKTYFMAETTVPDFKIGTSSISNAEILEHPEFYQVPHKSPNFYTVNGNQALPLLDIEDEE